MIRPKKKWGQHFLEDEKILKKMVEAAEIKPQDTVVEIGAGTGNLTFFLAQTKAQILALEKDRDLIKRLTKRLKRFKNLKIINQDARFFDYQSLDEYKVVANLPYSITSFILRKILTEKSDSSSGCQILVLMVQKEVAEKIIAPAGSSVRSLLTILIQMAGKVKILFEVSKEKFYPRSKVDSAVIKIVPQTVWDPKQERFFKFIKAGFANRRRQLVNSLTGALAQEKKIVYNILQSAKINPQARAEDLTLKEWEKLYAKVKEELNQKDSQTLVG
jgi:16S rRNA (adenine1518-N6/adenine1519-N6)-dimethyltransferase